jgi:hypothetical protein
MTTIPVRIFREYLCPAISAAVMTAPTDSTVEILNFYTHWAESDRVIAGRTYATVCACCMYYVESPNLLIINSAIPVMIATKMLNTTDLGMSGCVAS